jgi:hypothetical protein
MDCEVEYVRADLAAPPADGVVVPKEQWDTFCLDYNRYVDGDPKMPFSELRLSLALLLESAAPKGGE